LFQEQEWKVIQMMKSADKTKYPVTGLGMATVYEELSYKVPKTVEDKERFFNWISDNKGADVLTAMLSINARTNNSFCKTEKENATLEGNAAFVIPGIEDPISSTKLRWTKEK